MLYHGSQECLYISSPKLCTCGGLLERGFGIALVAANVLQWFGMCRVKRQTPLHTCLRPISRQEKPLNVASYDLPVEGILPVPKFHH